MKIATTREDLLKLLAPLVHVSSQNKIKPLQQNIKIEAYKDRALFIARSEDCEIIKSLKGTSELPGTATFPGKEVFEIVKEMHAEKPIRLELLEDNRLLLKQGRSASRIPTVDPKLIVNPLFFKSEEYTPIGPSALLKALNQTSYCASKDEIRPALNGILLDSFEEGMLRAVATDGNRLTTFRFPGVLSVPVTPGQIPSVILEHTLIELLKKVLPETEELGIKVLGGHISFCLDDGIVNGRLIDKAFPDYRKVFPTGTSMLVNLNKEDTIKALKRACLFLAEGTKVILKVLPGFFEIQAKTSKGEHVESLEALEGTESQPMDMAINPRYLLQAIEHFPDEVVPVRIYGQLLPVLIAQENISSMIMPMKL